MTPLPKATPALPLNLSGNTLQSLVDRNGHFLQNESNRVNPRFPLASSWICPGGSMTGSVSGKYSRWHYGGHAPFQATPVRFKSPAFTASSSRKAPFAPCPGSCKPRTKVLRKTPTSADALSRVTSKGERRLRLIESRTGVLPSGIATPQKQASCQTNPIE
jgi:hypothetical protein